MDKERIERLKALSKRATDAHVLDYGTANVVISAADFCALEEAIEILLKKK